MSETRELRKRMERMERMEALGQLRDGLRLDSELHLMLLNDDGKLTPAERDLFKRTRDAISGALDWSTPASAQRGDRP